MKTIDLALRVEFLESEVENLSGMLMVLCSLISSIEEENRVKGAISRFEKWHQQYSLDVAH